MDIAASHFFNKLHHWCLMHEIEIHIEQPNVVVCNNQRFLWIDCHATVTNGIVELNLSSDACLQAIHKRCSQWIYQWGAMICCQPIGQEQCSFTLFLPKASTQSPQYIPFIHSSHEAGSGSGHWNYWILAAKRLGIECLCLVDHNTLGGIIAFQNACFRNKITPILGITVDVYIDDHVHYPFKLIAKGEDGWKAILNFNWTINVDRSVVVWSEVLRVPESVTVIVPLNFPLEILSNTPKSVFAKNNWYYSVTTYVERNRLNYDNVQAYYQTFNTNPIIPPILCDDWYGPVNVDASLHSRFFQSPPQFPRSLTSSIAQWKSQFVSPENSKKLLLSAITNANKLRDNWTVQFKLRLPQYPYHENPNQLFCELIEAGLSNIGRNNDQQYVARAHYERDIIVRAGFVSYFLILWDIIGWCKTNNILVGAGRGSAGGSLVAFLLNITEIDPLKYNLLFERFLNPGRLDGGSLPDIDTDFEASKRGLVKSYMEERFGKNNVCSVGTYQTFGLRSIVGEVLRNAGKMPPQEIAYITVMLDNIGSDDWSAIFANAILKPKVYNAIQSHVYELSIAPQLIGSSKSHGVHACATIITPSEDDIRTTIPVRRNGDLIVSEWQGGELESLGFLKEDILGIHQLQKFAAILELIRINYGIECDLSKIDTNNDTVFQYFCNGWNEDVFHFGSPGLTQYCKQLQPSSLEDLIAAIALFRPGVLSLGFHLEYIARKNATSPVTYDHDLEVQALHSTYGLSCYQEQLLMLCKDVAGFSLSTADIVRKALGKKIPEIMEKYREEFVSGAQKNEVDRHTALKIWAKIEAGAGYSFNRSHAAAYALTGYRSQWLKVNYPIEYWQVALSHAPDGATANRYVKEIRATGVPLDLVGGDVNYASSQVVVKPNSKNGRFWLIWPLNKILGCGESVVNFIAEERRSNGEYFSLEECISRWKKFSQDNRNIYRRCPVTKATIQNMIYAGAFDSMYGVASPLQRESIIKKMFELFDNLHEYLKLPEESRYEYWWQIQQLRLSGVGGVDLQQILIQNRPFDMDDQTYDKLHAISDINDSMIKRFVTVGGIVEDVRVRKSKNGNFGTVILADDSENITVTLWSDVWRGNSTQIAKAKGRVMFVTGIVRHDNYSDKLAIHSVENTQFFII